MLHRRILHISSTWGFYGFISKPKGGGQQHGRRNSKEGRKTPLEDTNGLPRTLGPKQNIFGPRQTIIGPKHTSSGKSGTDCSTSRQCTTWNTEKRVHFSAKGCLICFLQKGQIDFAAEYCVYHIDNKLANLKQKVCPVRNGIEQRGLVNRWVKNGSGEENLGPGAHLLMSALYWRR